MQFSDYHFIGAGGIGSWLIPAAVRLLAYAQQEYSAPFIYDGDSFEEHNSERQLCGADQLGLNKATAMSEVLAQQGLNSTPVDKFVDKPVLRTMLKHSDAPLVISCVDNDATRKLIIDVLEERQLDFVHITCGNSDGTDSIRASCHWHGVMAGQQIGINPALLFQNLTNPTDHAPVAGTCSAEAPSRPQLIAANFSAANLAITVLTNLLQGELDLTAHSAFANGRTFKTAIN